MPANTPFAEAVELAVDEIGEAVAGLGVASAADALEDAHIFFDAARARIDSAPTIPPVEPDDAQLIARAREGDLDAFADLVRRYERRVRGVLVRLLDDERDVEEATQDVFVQAWRNLSRYRGDSAPFTWLYRIAVNDALMRQRRRRPPTRELDESREAAEPAPDDELRRFLLARIGELPLDERAPLVLRDLQGLSNQEVADVLGLSLAATKSRIHRARMRLRAAYEDWQRER
jgi:RNA polymerase sigma-70 factor, ECF subfamily